MDSLTSHTLHPSGRPVWMLIAGPSGVGKTTVVEQLLAAYHPQLLPVVTATTRAPRAGESEGVQYYFLTPAQFAAKEAAGDFLETIERHTIRYGTPIDEIRKKLSLGRDLIMHVDWQGAAKIKKLAATQEWIGKTVVSIFVRPTSVEMLRTRLILRGRNTPEEIEARLKVAREDIMHADEFDFSFTTGTPQQDFEQLKSLYLSQKSRQE